MRRSSKMEKRESLNSSALELNTSLRLNTLEDCNAELSGHGGSQLTERSITESQFNQEEMKVTKKKMGVQLSILEKNLFYHSKPNMRERANKLNRTVYLDNEKPLKRKSSLNISQTALLQSKIPKAKAIMKPAKVQVQRKLTPMTSADLQQIRKIDKDIYQLYLDLYHDLKQQLQKEKTNSSQIQHLIAQIKSEENKQNQIKQTTEQIITKQYEMAERTKQNEMYFITQMRKKMLQSF